MRVYYYGTLGQYSWPYRNSHSIFI
jgi:hypothetical protein